MTRLIGGNLKHSTTVRFVLLYLVLTMLGMLPALFFVYQQTNGIITRTYRSTVEDRTAILMEKYQAGGTAELARQVNERSHGLLSHGALLLTDRSGQKIAGNIDTWPPSLGARTRWQEMLLYREGHAQPEQFGLSTFPLSSGDRLLVGVVVDDRGSMRMALLIALLGALLLAIPIGLLGSLVLARFMNSRVNAIGNVAARIAAGDLTRRVETRGTTDPFDRLGMALNGMLGRTECLVQQLRLVTDALAHDLRSPLMRIRAAMDRAEQATTNQARGRAMDAISHDVDGMLRIIAFTLEISRAEAGVGRENFVWFDLRAMLLDLCEMYHPLFEECGSSAAVILAAPKYYFGNRELLGQAISNLLDNALKYADGSVIELGAEDEGDEIRLWVADRGPGIPENQRANAIQKYHRLEQARTSEGSGLGLAMVNAVARLHGGQLELGDNEPGLRASIMLKRFELKHDSIADDGRRETQQALAAAE